MTEDEIRAGLSKFSAVRVSKETGLAYFSVWRFMAGKLVRPSWALVSRLEQFLKDEGVR